MYGKRCYHVEQMTVLENERFTAEKLARQAVAEAERIVAKTPVNTLLAQPIVAPKIVEARPQRDMLNAPLNGKKAFSILR